MHYARVEAAEARVAAVRALADQLEAEAEQSQGGRYDGLHHAVDRLRETLPALEEDRDE
jgi:hypothetical protein